jgi:hypothetical protein
MDFFNCGISSHLELPVNESGNALLKQIIKLKPT